MNSENRTNHNSPGQPSNLIRTTRNVSNPTHWKSVALSFGSNPKKSKKKMGKNYVDSYDKFRKKSQKSIDEQSNNGGDVVNVPDELKPQQVEINNLRDNILAIEQDLAAKKSNLNNKIKEMQNRLHAANQTNQLRQQQNQPTQVPQNQPV